MRKLTILLLVSLLAVAVAMPAEAGKKKKKKKKPVPIAVAVDYFLRADEACTESADRQLKLTPSDDGSNCGSFDMGPPNAVSLAAGGEPTIRDYTATEGVPFVLDTSQPLAGLIAVSSWGPASAGPTTLVVNVVATIDGEEQVIAEMEESYTAGPGAYEYEFETDIAGDFDSKEVTSLKIELYNHGVAPTHGYYRSHTPNSFITVPTWQMP